MQLISFALLLIAACAHSEVAIGINERKSGTQFMAASTQAMQNNDTLNPGMLWVKDGEALWQSEPASNSRSCASCHSQASMKGVASRYPAFDDLLERPVNLSQRINQCRQKHQTVAPLKAESQELLGLESFVAHQSRGLPLAPPGDSRLDTYRERGQQRYNQQIGQLNLSCSQCHNSNAGGRLGSSLIPQAHPTGYPVYRLEWQTLGSLQRRLRNCMSGVRAEPFAYGAQELVELELHLAVRAKGMLIESPGVRP